ncbi:MAG: MFS transporter [Mycobacteriales bacterium]
MTDSPTISDRRRLLAYASGGFGLGVSTLMYFLVPLRAAEMGVGVAVIGLLLGAEALTEMIVSVPLGGLIDRAGARRAYLAGTLGLALVGVGFMLASSLALLFVLQVAFGVARPLGWLGGQAYVSGMRSPAERSQDSGRFSFVANLGQIVAPVLAGAAVQLAGVQVAFALVTLFGVAFFAVGLGLPDDRCQAPSQREGRATFRPAARLLTLRGMQIVMLLTFTRLWLMSMWSAFLPLYLVGIGTAPGVVGSAVSTMALVATLTSLLTGRIARLGRATFVGAGGLAVSCAGVALSPVVTTVPGLYLPAALVGIGMGLSLPMLLVLVAANAPPGQRSLALGLRASVNQGAATAAPVLVAPVIGIVGLALGFPLAAVVGGLILCGAVSLEVCGPREGVGAA